MSGLRGRERLQPSLLDRLTDHNPSQKRETGDQQSLTMQQLRQAVLRDLAWLLNATNLVTVDEDMAERPLLANSTLNYGIPGFAGMIESSGRVSALEKELATAIRRYEPRIRPETLRVRARGSGEGTSPSLVFEIEGELWAQPVPVQLFLQTQIEVETRLAVVSEAKSSR
jgi:type VI secretion system protein ImpF